MIHHGQRLAFGLKARHHRAESRPGLESSPPPTPHRFLLPRQPDHAKPALTDDFLQPVVPDDLPRLLDTPAAMTAGQPQGSSGSNPVASADESTSAATRSRIAASPGHARSKKATPRPILPEGLSLDRRVHVLFVLARIRSSSGSLISAPISVIRLIISFGWLMAASRPRSFPCGETRGRRPTCAWRWKPRVAQQLRGFGVGHTREKPQRHEPGSCRHPPASSLPSASSSSKSERSGSVSHATSSVPGVHAPEMSAVPDAGFAPRSLNQNPPHRECRRAKKVRPVIPRGANSQAQERFVHERCRLQRLPGRLHRSVGSPPACAVPPFTAATTPPSCRDRSPASSMVARLTSRSHSQPAVLPGSESREEGTGNRRR